MEEYEEDFKRFYLSIFLDFLNKKIKKKVITISRLDTLSVHFAGSAELSCHRQLGDGAPSNKFKYSKLIIYFLEYLIVYLCFFL